MATKVKTVAEGAGRLDVEIAREKFADAVVVKGLTQGEAYLEGHPKCNLSGHALRVKANEYAKTPAVAAAIEEARSELRAKNAAFGERLIGYLRADIDRAIRECNSLEPVMKQAALAADVLGLKKQTVDVNAKVGPIDSSSAKDKLTFLAQNAAKENAS